MPASPSIFAFFGTDEARAKDAALALSKKLSPADDEFGLEVVAGTADNSDEASKCVSRAIESIQTLPFFGGDKVVWLQDVNFLGDSQTGKAEATLSAVESLLQLLEAGLPSDVKFILNASEVDKRRSFFKKLSKIAKVETFDKADISKAGWEAQVMDFALGRSHEVGLKFSHDALERFVLLVGNDSRQIQNEIEKLSLYVGDREATIEDVRETVAASHTGIIFEIGDALARRNLPLTISLIEKQLRSGQNPIGLLLAAIVPRVRQLLYSKDLMERHGLRAGRDFKSFEREVGSIPKSETAHLPRKKDGSPSCYPLFLAIKQGGNFTSDELKEALFDCLEANLRLVTTALEPQLVLNQLVTRILTRGRERKSA